MLKKPKISKYPAFFDLGLIQSNGDHPLVLRVRYEQKLDILAQLNGVSYIIWLIKMKCT